MNNGITIYGEKLHFLNLFSEDKVVEIPMIQRDYAQGRESAKDVRDSFLSYLFSALQRNEARSLDFVYGKVVEKTFQPIDGQQRLTTLFLLHWYLAHCANKSVEFTTALNLNGDNRFCYLVRPSSRRFFSKLLTYTPESLKQCISEQIKNQNWFFNNLLRDPTVFGALTVLDAIQQRCCCLEYRDLKNFYDRLCCITMEVLDLGDAISSDDIYLRMNARGKELTGFEKFKAWLIKKFSEFKWSVPESPERTWKLMLDVDWLELFWHFHKTKETPDLPVSKSYYRLFAALAVNHHASENKIDNQEAFWSDDESEHNETVWEKLFNDESCLKTIFDSLHVLSSNSEQKWMIEQLRERQKADGVGPFNDKALDDVFFEEPQQNITFNARVWLYAIGMFFRFHIPHAGQEERHWFRVVRNLIYNTEIDAKNFINTIESIGKLALLTNTAKGSVLEALSRLQTDDSWKPQQLKNQLNEEIQKAQLILPLTNKEKDWESAIIEAENHSVLLGQIEILLSSDNDIGSFNKRWAVLTSVLDKNGDRIGKNDHLLTRASLVCCTPISLNSRDRIELPSSSPEWAISLSRNRRREAFRNGMKKLIHLLVDKSNCEAKVCRNMIDSDQINEAWMKDVIHHGDCLLKQSSTRKIQNYYNNGVFLYYKTNSTDDDILLGWIAKLRNQLIQRMVNGSTPDEVWSFASGADKQKRCVVAIKDPNTCFFKGHRIKLIKGDCNSVFCLFDYKVLHIGDSSNSALPNVEIAYPDDGDPNKLLALLRRPIADAQESKRVQAVIHQLIKFCELCDDPKDHSEKASSMHPVQEGVTNHA